MSTSPIRRSHAQILVVEDDEDLSKSLGSFLKGQGFLPDFAWNGQEAVDKFQTRQFSLIFMDVRMPIKDGIAATREIRDIEEEEGIQEGIPIIGYTRNAATVSKACFSAGMNECVQKPADRAVLKEILGRYLPSSLTKGP